MRIDVLTLFPDAFSGPLQSSILGRALESRVAITSALSAIADAFVQMTAHPDIDRVARVAVETLTSRLGGVAARLWTCMSANSSDRRTRVCGHTSGSLSPRIPRRARMSRSTGASICFVRT